MYLIYNTVARLVWLVLRLVGLWNPKISKFVSGRNAAIATLKQAVSASEDVVWVHAASLGEYEQGLPIMERLRSQYPATKIVLSFFSPSGYEVQKNSAAADVVVYLPFDTKSKVTAFLDATHPKLAIFIKYEIWPNYLAAVKERNIPTVLVSGLFKKEQVYFQFYGSFMRTALAAFTHFYLQDQPSQQLLETIGYTNSTVAGDTRLDRVSEIVDADNMLLFMDQFLLKDSFCLVAGSTWPEDEKLLIHLINKSPASMKFVIAPHNINQEHCLGLQDHIHKPTVLYSAIASCDLETANVLILDTIGVLTKVYSYASIAYVGGGFLTGLHNTLEPAVFGIPVIIGPNYNGFREAETLVRLGGLTSIASQTALDARVHYLYENRKEREEQGAINTGYILNNKGASQQILEGIAQWL